MVIIKSVKERQTKEGKPFIMLELIGDVELIQSQTTGRFYATSKRCFVSSTFDRKTAEQFLGSRLSGKIVRTSCETYDFTVPESGEVIQLAYRYDYVPEDLAAPVRQVENNAAIPEDLVF